MIPIYSLHANHTIHSSTAVVFTHIVLLVTYSPCLFVCVCLNILNVPRYIVVSLSSDNCTCCKSIWIKASAKCKCLCVRPSRRSRPPMDQRWATAPSTSSTGWATAWWRWAWWTSCPPASPPSTCTTTPSLPPSPWAPTLHSGQWAFSV